MFELIEYTVDELLLSLAVGVVSGTKIMGFDGDGEESAAEASKTKTPAETDDESESGGMGGSVSESSLCATEDEEDEDGRKIELGPQCTIKEHFEKDKVEVLPFYFLNYTYMSFSGFFPFDLFLYFF